MTVKDIVKSYLLSVKRQGMKELVEALEKHTDYFTAPASATFHLAREGGLLEHSFNVFQIFSIKNTTFKLGIPEDSVIICGLLHDLAKTNMYAKQADGSYIMKDEAKGRGHGKLSVERIKKFIALTIEEEDCIRYHMGLFSVYGYDNYKAEELHEVIKRNRSVQIFASADMESTQMEDIKEKERTQALNTNDCLSNQLKKEKDTPDLTALPLPLANMNGMSVLSSESINVHYLIMKLNGEVYSTKFGDYSAGTAKLQFVKTKNVGYENNLWFKGKFVEGANHTARPELPFEINIYTKATKKKDEEVDTMPKKGFKPSEVLEFIQGVDKGTGVDAGIVQGFFGVQDAQFDGLMKKLVEMGEIFECKTGRYKVLS